MKIEDLNGFWTISYQFDADLIRTPNGESLFPLTEAYVCFVNGRFGGADIGGCTCVGAGTLNADGTVTLESVWDASRAAANVWLPTPQGVATKGQVSMVTTLQIVSSDTKLTAYGTVAVGPVVIDVNAERLRGLDG